MTKELAIRILTGDVLCTDEQTHEAIKMAVELLMQPDVIDTIYRQDVIDRAISIPMFGRDIKMVAISEVERLPPAQPEVHPIEYRDCANAMLRMWMDNVVTDGEYNCIMDKLNAHWKR